MCKKINSTTVLQYLSCKMLKCSLEPISLKIIITFFTDTLMVQNAKPSLQVVYLPESKMEYWRLVGERSQEPCFIGQYIFCDGVSWFGCWNWKRQQWQQLHPREPPFCRAECGVQLVSARFTKRFWKLLLQWSRSNAEHFSRRRLQPSLTWKKLQWKCFELDPRAGFCVQCEICNVSFWFKKNAYFFLLTELYGWWNFQRV